MGGVFAALAWLAVSSLFSWYLGKSANYNATYRTSVSGGVGLMMWMWLSIIVVMVGAELNSEMEHQTAHDSTVGLAKPLGVRGAVMADTVGAGLSLISRQPNTSVVRARLLVANGRLPSDHRVVNHPITGSLRPCSRWPRISL